MRVQFRSLAVTAGLGLAIVATPVGSALADELAPSAIAAQGTMTELVSDSGSCDGSAAAPGFPDEVDTGVATEAADSEKNKVSVSDDQSAVDASHESVESSAGSDETAGTATELPYGEQPEVPDSVECPGVLAEESIVSGVSDVEAQTGSDDLPPALSETGVVGGASEPGGATLPQKGWQGSHYWDGSLTEGGGEKLFTGWVVDDHEGQGLQRYWVENGEKVTNRFFEVGDGTFGYALDSWVLRGISDVIGGLIYIANNDGALLAPGWHVTGEFTNGGLQRYYIEDDYVAHVGYSESGWAHYTTSYGYVARGKFVDRDGSVLLANNDGLVERDGWLVTGKYDGGGLQRYYVEDGAAKLGEFTVDSLKYYGLGSEGYVLRWLAKDSAGRTMYANNDGVLYESTWVVTSALGQGLQRYWFDAAARMAVSRLIDPTNARDAGSGWYAYARPEGYVVRGSYSPDSARVYLANNDGVLAGNGATGWVVSDEYGQLLQRYWIEADHAAHVGYGAGGGGHYTTNAGYVLRGALVVGDRVYLADNDGVLAGGTTGGWVVSDKYGHGLQRYWIDPTLHAAVMGYSSDGYLHYTTSAGYVLRNNRLWRVGADYTGIYYAADNDGLLTALDNDYSRTVNAYTNWMVAIANDNAHGYDQLYRWGEFGDYDCSSLVIAALRQAGVNTGAADDTKDMLLPLMNAGFEWIRDLSDLQRGDILLNERHHTAVYLGNGMVVQASINERGGITGGRPGDQTGREIWIRSYYDYPWDGILRLKSYRA